MRFVIESPALPGATRAIDVELRSSGGATCQDPEGEIVFDEVIETPDGLLLRIGTRVFDVRVARASGPNGVFQLALGAQRAEAIITSERERRRARLQDAANGSTGSAKDRLLSPMSGRVTRVLVQDGGTVRKGAPLVVIEAMKMENELLAATDVHIETVLVRAGDTVERGTALLAFRGQDAPR